MEAGNGGTSAAAGTGNGGDGAAQPGGTGTGGQSGGGGISGGNTGGVGGSSVCANYDDEAPAALRVMILNKTDAPIYLGQDMMTCSQAPLFEVADARGGKLPSWGGGCNASCSDLRMHGVIGCPAICFFPTSIMLQPGEQRFAPWSGLYAVPAVLPAECVPFESGDTSISCQMAKRIVPGTYEFSARAGTSLDCSQTTANSACSACMSDGQGGCITAGSLITGKILTAKATVDLNQSYGVYGSSADAPAPGGNSGATANQAIELVFTNP